ncbi:hypothetical protein KMP13_04230 [Epibacterium ulvae]|uniref:ATP-grasp domain-containing protein n=1 Tax=Epibacterium ulvae TaxID=1156985 RepID=UPI001BFCC1FF|nr:hypothetical protein [Epibacterium ulvae]MBT8153108.1 hypothetical protein [Epibacterium ulvae]
MEPQPRIGLAALAELAFGGGDVKSFYNDLIALIKEDPTNAGIMMDLSIAAQLEGHQELGLAWQDYALDISRVFQPIREVKAKRTVLIYAAPIHMGGNTPVDLLLGNDAFDVVTYYPHFDMKPDEYPTLPPHDVAFCAAPADHEQAEQFFETVRRIAALQGVDVLNLPHHLVKPERDTVPELLGNVQGLRTPKTLEIDRATLQRMLAHENESEALAETAVYPFVVRPVGSHAGAGLAKVETRADFTAYLETRPEEAFFVSEFMDYASPKDGQFRKARIVCIDGKAYPSHYAIADRWDIWYANAKMEECAVKRREEEAFMETFAEGFGKRHQATFDAITAVIGLDYYGIDCAEDADGNLVLFEIDNALIVHDLDSPEIYPYKHKHMQNVFDAFENLLTSKCRVLDMSVPTGVIANIPPIQVQELRVVV